MKIFKNKNILLGVTGSIAAYKACEVLRLLQRLGADVKVVMTEAAEKFIGKVTFEALSGNRVITELFPEERITEVEHIKIAEWADCILICPATANIIGKISSGIADDFLTTTVMAARSVVILAPAMDHRMVKNPIYISNCEKLKKHGYRFVTTEKGYLASGAEGEGRLARPETIIDSVKMVLIGSKRLSGKKVLVTAGPTREYLDPVRFISNPSSGRMGFALAEQAALRGAEVTLISGPSRERYFTGVSLKMVETSEEMKEAVLEEWKDSDVLIMSAAVADFRPKEIRPEKIKKDISELKIKLQRVEDILSLAAKKKQKRIVVGFALETEAEEENAFKKLKEKNLDLICLNNPKEEGAGFEVETNRITLIQRNGERETLPLMTKYEAAGKILDRVEKLMEKIER